MGMFTLAFTVLVVAAPDLPPGTPKLPPGFSIEKMSDPKAAAEAANWIEKEYKGKPTEAARMLVAILRGLKADGSNGWFSPAESRYTWQWLAERSGQGAKATAIANDKFTGSAALFDKLDRDGDGRITPQDLDWSDRNPYVMQVAMITRLFRRMASA